MSAEPVSQRVKTNPGTISPAPKINPQNKSKPTSLSTSDSELRNYPMWIDLECEYNESAVTLEGYQGLWDRSYMINSADRNFTKNISRSVYNY
jgi:hypothetical protein